jgi:hypothetical protein
VAIVRTSQFEASRITPTPTPITLARTTPISATLRVLRRPMRSARQ